MHLSTFSRISTALATCLFTVAPLAAQETAPAAVQPPVVEQVAPMMEAPAQPQAGSAVDAAPILPGAEAAAPNVAAPTGVTPQATPQVPNTPAATTPATTAPATQTPAADSTAPAATATAAATGVATDTPAATEPAATEPAATEPAAVEHGLSQHDLSPYGMYMAADIIVKGVMIGLALATFITLTIMVYKIFEVALAKRALRRSLMIIREAATLSTAASSLKGRSDPAAFMTRAALDELGRSTAALDVAGNEGVKERTHSIIERTEAQAGRRLMRGTGVLATIGSTAPFIGLFGTVWGIMNSFVSIAESQTTNLAVVAPGIAEALLATAIGLVAAIPAVIVYNHFARQIQGYKLQLGDAGAGVERLLSRDLDFRNVTPA